MIEIGTKNTVAEPAGTIILKKKPILLYYKNLSLTFKKKKLKN